MDDSPLERIRTYLERAKTTDKLYPLEEKGFFKVLGHYDDWLDNPDRDYDPVPELGIFEGRFIDAVAYATQLKNFEYMEKVDVKQIKVLNKDLASIVTNYARDVDEIKKQIEALNKDLASIVTNYAKDAEEVEKSLGELEKGAKNQ